MDSVRVERLEAEGLANPVVWLPFELHPEVPREGMPTSEYFPPGYLERADEGMQAMAREAGLTMRRRDRLINTRLALATAELARERGCFDQVHHALFRAHWEGTGNLDDALDLKRIGAENGLDPDEVGEVLADGRYEDVIDANRREATSVGVNAIPAHIFGRRFLVVGAHPYEIFKQVVERVQSEPEPPSGEEAES